MLFNTLDYAAFLVVIFLLYWFVAQRNLRLQNGLLLIASYLFYGWWDYRFLALIVISSLADYLIGLSLANQSIGSRRRTLLILSLVINLGILGFFKYYNFFVDQFVSVLDQVGLSFDTTTLGIILPVGISFYTFQTLSYTIDIYRRRIDATRDVIAFFAFVSFFPQLVAGPIERAKNLLPQFHKQRQFDIEKAKDGLRQILWGLVKKVVVADTCASQVNYIFEFSDSLSGSILLLGAILFAFQIYGDFSGYSDIAIGSAKLFGFDLMTNFKMPYFSRSVAEFWRRWHISLSSWFRDYVFIPLGGSKGKLGVIITNLMITFAISGFWHGAKWTFIVWGLLNAVYYIPLLVFKINTKYKTNTLAENSLFPSIKEIAQVVSTFLLITISWVFFRAESIGHATQYLSAMFSESLFSYPSHVILTKLPLALIGILLLVEYIQRNQEHGLALDRAPAFLRWSACYVAIVGVCYIDMLADHVNQSFIYFQF